MKKDPGEISDKKRNAVQKSRESVALVQFHDSQATRAGKTCPLEGGKPSQKITQKKKNSLNVHQNSMKIQDWSTKVEIQKRTVELIKVKHSKKRVYGKEKERGKRTGHETLTTHATLHWLFRAADKQAPLG